jgi:hypothetical protein
VRGQLRATVGGDFPVRGTIFPCSRVFLQENPFHFNGLRRGGGCFFSFSLVFSLQQGKRPAKRSAPQREDGRNITKMVLLSTRKSVNGSMGPPPSLAAGAQDARGPGDARYFFSGGLAMR